VRKSRKVQILPTAYTFPTAAARSGATEEWSLPVV